MMKTLVESDNVDLPKLPYQIRPINFEKQELALIQEEKDDALTFNGSQRKETSEFEAVPIPLNFGNTQKTKEEQVEQNQETPSSKRSQLIKKSGSYELAGLPSAMSKS